MGLSSQLNDVSSDSIPILLVATAAGWVSYLRSLLHCLLDSVGLHHHHIHEEEHGAWALYGSTLAGLIVLAEQLSAQRAFSYGGEHEGDDEAGVVGAEPDCVVCLSQLREGERVRRLSCCRRVFHSDCLDGWFDHSNLTCPLCRAPLVPDRRRADTGRRIGAELVEWLSPCRTD